MGNIIGGIYDSIFGPQQKRFTDPIMTTYETLEDLQNAMTNAGLESSNLIVGIDFTASNEWTGKRTYRGRSLHDVSNPNDPNPYMRVMDIMGRALAPYDDDGFIPVFGFGDAFTNDRAVFDLSPYNQPFYGMQQALEEYKNRVNYIKLSGPTSFVPLIEKAIEIVRYTRKYHILVIICDGEVTSVEKNRKVIEEASNYALSIICVGV